MKLTKLITRIAMSLIPYDIVFYKDENNRIYRLMKTPYIGYNEMDFLDMAVNKAKYAPEIVDGDIVDENDKEIRIRGLWFRSPYPNGEDEESSVENCTRQWMTLYQEA